MQNLIITYACGHTRTVTLRDSASEHIKARAREVYSKPRAYRCDACAAAAPGPVWPDPIDPATAAKASKDAACNEAIIAGALRPGGYEDTLRRYGYWPLHHL